VHLTVRPVLAGTYGNVCMTTHEQPITDAYQRRIDYLRLSITDRCNLRCVYCMPPEGVPDVPHREILRYEEILRLAGVAVSLGITKIRVTGGEPLVRQGVLTLLRQLAAIPGVQSLSITTNGVLLSEFAQDLYQAGIRRLNISLDTLKPSRYRDITRQDRFAAVWRGIQQALEVGFHPIKLNTVVLKGINDDEVEELAKLTYEFPFHVRFIELMPFAAITSEHYLSGDEILARLCRVDRLLPTLSNCNNGPARYFQFPGAKGKIGLINPLSHHSCNTCNRLRLTADGQLRTCLFATTEISLKKLLRQGASDEEVRQAMYQAIKEKPRSWAGEEGLLRKCLNRPMRAIGG
jgi:cyclic pyranopterin phosphate synthase